MTGNRETFLTDEQRTIKSRFKEEVGYWNERYEPVLRADPEYFDHFRRLAAHAYDDRELDPKTKELLLVSVNAAPTHLHEPGIRTHVRNAFDFGATFEEVRTVVFLSAGQAIHSITEGVPILLEEAGEPPTPPENEQEEQERVKEHFVEKRGYWSGFWDALLAEDHTFLEHYADLSAHPAETGPLDQKTIELVTIAKDAATTHLYLPGLRVHIQNALDLGATRGEVMEAIEIVSIMGMQSLAETVPILFEEAAERDVLPEA